MGKREVDKELLAKLLAETRLQFRMRMAIWMFLTEEWSKADLGRVLGVSRQHISRTINDFLQKNAQKLFTS